MQGLEASPYPPNVRALGPGASRVSVAQWQAEEEWTEGAVHFHVLRMTGSLLAWIGMQPPTLYTRRRRRRRSGRSKDSRGALRDNLSLCMSGVGSAQVLGDSETARRIAAHVAAKTKQHAFVTYGVPDAHPRAEMLAAWCEKQLFAKLEAALAVE